MSAAIAAVMRCYGAQAGDCPNELAARYHVLTDWSLGTLLLCEECVRWERQVNGLIWAHSLRGQCLAAVPGEEQHQ